MKSYTVRRRQRHAMALTAILVVGLLVGCAQTGTAPSSVDAVHAAYLDLSGNVADLRSRVAAWQKGDKASLAIAEEKLERTQVVLGAVTWPKALAEAIAQTKAAVGPLTRALAEKDWAAAEASAQALGDASHDVTHAFYGDWLPGPEAAQLDLMAPHVTYLDLSANLSDLQTRVGQWQKGDESSLNIAREKAERIDVLLQHMATSRVMVKDIQALERALPAVSKALENKDLAATQQSLQPIADASRALAREAYAWLDLVAATDPACVQASYLDLSRNIAELRTSAAEWQKGDGASLATAQEKLARVKVVLAHPVWPGALVSAIDESQTAVTALETALAGKNPAAVEAATKSLGDASHDVTHAFYGDWLIGAAMAGHQTEPQGVQAGGNATTPSESHTHGSASADNAVSTTSPDWPVVGGFAAVLMLIIGIAALTKPKATTNTVARASLEGERV